MASSSPPPLSSSPPDFTLSSSSPLSNNSTWSDGSDGCATTASTSTDMQTDSAGAEDEFTRRLHDLLVVVMRERQSDELKRQLKGDDGNGDGGMSYDNGDGPHDVHVARTNYDTTRDISAGLNTPGLSPHCPMPLHTHETRNPFGHAGVPITHARTLPQNPVESDLSTLVFASPASDLIQSSTQPRSAPPGYRYRIIHRAVSYRPRQKHMNATFSPRSKGNCSHPYITDTDTDSQPPRKRPKILTRTSTHTRIRTELARTPASLRRAASLRSIPDNNEGEGETQNDIATVPVTPEQRHNANVKTTLSRTKPGLWLGLGPVPIIAPPLPLPPPPTQMPVYIRVSRLLEREAGLRAEMGLATQLGAEGGGAWDCDAIDEELRACVIRWFLEVTPPAPMGPTRTGDCHSHVSVDCSESGDSDDDEEDVGCGYSAGTPSCSSSGGGKSSRSCSTTSSSTATASSYTTRGTTPTPRIRLFSPSPSSSSSSYFSSTFPSTTNDDPTPRPRYPSNLHDQLATSPVTRFHAAYLFLRFFHAVGRSHRDRDAEEGEDEDAGKLVFGPELDEEGKVLVTWDIAVACLALSVKYHRDFLHPLFPVYAYEFQRLAPHGVIGFEDLEIAHRDVLSALKWRLGDTPQALVLELWDALPGLRRLFGGDGDRKRERDCDQELELGWNCVQRETWRVLFVAALEVHAMGTFAVYAGRSGVRGLCALSYANADTNSHGEPDILRFPLSLLTSAALLHGACVVLQGRYEDAAPWYLYELCSGATTTRKPGMGKRAVRAVRGVRRELGKLLDVDEEAMEGCWVWLGRVLGR
ncbi:hypothetical protein FPV67DRAFT_1782761 [Lyophyllum atratum]|nr:hypothetical protein FPV67DRAFT_1782761 [Lyophyllum atratum]